MLREAWAICDTKDTPEEKSQCKATLIKGQPLKVMAGTLPANPGEPRTNNKKPLNSQDLLEVGRGGPFTISRCWRRSDINTKPSVKCGNTIVTDGCYTA